MDIIKRIINILVALPLLGMMTACSDRVQEPDIPIIDEPEPEPLNVAIDISSPYRWSLSSVPALFPEATLSNDVSSGKNRALLSWYQIDLLFIDSRFPQVPEHIKNDLDALSYPYAREVSMSELYPSHEPTDGESLAISTLNLSFYPMERGPYNLDGTNVDPEGHLLNPEKRWGGIMRPLEKYNLEQAGIKYLQFWLLDPFMDVDLGNHDGGYLYFNLGELSEDILKDGFMNYENGLPVDGDSTTVVQTVWGRVPSKSPIVYAFGKSSVERILQDVGLDGLSNQEEYQHPSYARYLQELRRHLSASTCQAMYDDPFSPFNDPAGDLYSFYLNSYYNLKRLSINDRYKHYNGTEGNSLVQNDATSVEYQPSRTMPDYEDISQDGVMNQDERFFQYRIAIHPDSMRVGTNYITSKHVAHVRTRNGKAQVATWYLFTIPLTDYERKIGSIQDFSNIRQVRMFMTGFRGVTHLRFATLGFTGDN